MRQHRLPWIAMRNTGSAILLTTILLLAGAAIGVLLPQCFATAHSEPSADFQRLVGGLGFGPALDPSVCPFSFDPRLEADCHEQGGPIPGGERFCPNHGCSVFYYESLD